MGLTYVAQICLNGMGLVWYKDKEWNWRMALYALEELKARRDKRKKY